MSTIEIEPTTAVCPSWCVAEGHEGAEHAHVSDDVVAAAEGGHPLVARLIQPAGSAEVRVLLNDRIATLDQTRSFAHSLQRLVGRARLAEPGLGFLSSLLAMSGVTFGELALAAGVDVHRVRAQRAGGQVLTLSEFDQLALTAARLVSERRSAGS